MQYSVQYKSNQFRQLIIALSLKLGNVQVASTVDFFDQRVPFIFVRHRGQFFRLPDALFTQQVAEVGGADLEKAYYTQLFTTKTFSIRNVGLVLIHQPAGA